MTLHVNLTLNCGSPFLKMETTSSESAIIWAAQVISLFIGFRSKLPNLN